jgi:signal transduction histidine kinase
MAMDAWLERFALASFLRSADTAHDLKTPLNVAVLNLELMRMRIRKLADGVEDVKIASYATSIEMELRRMARIFDTFFSLSTPPKNEGEPVAIDVCPICKEAASAVGYEFSTTEPATILGHESRIRQAFKLFFEGASKVLSEEERRAEVSRDTHFHVVITGNPSAEDFEITKIFKFYYTDPSGNPDLSLAAARLIAEAYGGELKAAEESGKVTLRMSFPLGEK